MGSSIGQSILMAITVTVNKYASSNVQAVHSTRDRLSSTEERSGSGGSRRRGLVLAAVVGLVADSKTQLLSKYLKKSEENKAKNDKERLDNYYKRNYKDYFEFVEGSLEGKSEAQLTEAEKGIRDWLKANKQ
uniref:Uncharacterized protein n=1 Tax=Kalanchoe fedtschenkoi TaxID=63787 RepID=A0A7N0TN43_KALFE